MLLPNHRRWKTYYIQDMLETIGFSDLLSMFCVSINTGTTDHGSCNINIDYCINYNMEVYLQQWLYAQPLLQSTVCTQE